MSHSITLINELSLSNKLLILVNHSNQTNTKVRIKKSAILTKSTDNSGYKLGKYNTLVFLENHLNSRTKIDTRNILKQFLTDINEFSIKAKINIQEYQQSTKENQFRLISSKLNVLKY